MRYFLVLFILSVVLFSCDEDSPSGENNPNAIAVGNRIYSIEHGADQIGTKGQFLEDTIKISITDYEGKPVASDLSFELSSDEGQVIKLNSTIEGEEDWLHYLWQLACSDVEQTLTFIDNICDISRDGCTDVDVLEISVQANQSASGWIEACYNFNGSNDVKRFVVFNDKLYAYTSYELFSTQVVSTNQWQELETSKILGAYDVVSNYNNSQLVYSDYSTTYVTDDLISWSQVSMPYTLYGHEKMAILNNGTFVAVGEYSNRVYTSSDNGFNWTESISNISDITLNYSSKIVAITANENTAYIITDDDNVIALTNGIAKLHSFDSYSWGDIDISYAHAIFHEGFLILYYYDNSFYDSDYKAVVLNLSGNSVVSETILGGSITVHQDQGKIYFIENSTDAYYDFRNGYLEFNYFNLPEIKGNYYTSGESTIFNGQRVFYSNTNNKLYYYN